MSSSTQPLSLPLIGSRDPFPVNKIICIGRNYAEHAREMGHDPEREPPFFFFKPASALNQPGQDFVYPWFSREVHHELELVVALGDAGYQLTPGTATGLVAAFGVGLDMTCRDLQREAKRLGRPWELAKGFDGSAPCSALQPGTYADLQRLGRMRLTRNGQEVQAGHWRDMVWPVPELIAAVSRYVHLSAGDLIFTGTPAGVGPVEPGDRLLASCEGLDAQLTLLVIPAVAVPPA